MVEVRFREVIDLRYFDMFDSKKECFVLRSNRIASISKTFCTFLF